MASPNNSTKDILLFFFLKKIDNPTKLQATDILVFPGK